MEGPGSLHRRCCVPQPGCLPRAPGGQCPEDRPAFAWEPATRLLPVSRSGPGRVKGPWGTGREWQLAGRARLVCFWNSTGTAQPPRRRWVWWRRGLLGTICEEFGVSGGFSAVPHGLWDQHRGAQATGCAPRCPGRAF